MRQAASWGLLLLLPLAAAQPTTSHHNDPAAGYPRDLYVTNITETSAVLNWTWVSGCNEEDVFVDLRRDDGQVRGHRFAGNGTGGERSFAVADLQPGTRYAVELRIAESCGLGDRSDGSHRGEFWTLGVRPSPTPSETLDPHPDPDDGGKGGEREGAGVAAWLGLAALAIAVALRRRL